MTEDEKFVREHWESVREHDQRSLREAPKDWHGFVLVTKGHGEEMIASGNQAERWAAAAKFTLQRLEEIRQVEEEIAEITELAEQGSTRPGARLRILARRQAALSDLRKGMKESTNGTD
jgi:hypothetical protein